MRHLTHCMLLVFVFLVNSYILVKNYSQNKIKDIVKVLTIGYTHLWILCEQTRM